MRTEEIVAVVPEDGQPILKWRSGGEGVGVCDNNISCLEKSWSQGVERDLKCPLDQLLRLLYEQT